MKSLEEALSKEKLCDAAFYSSLAGIGVYSAISKLFVPYLFGAYVAYNAYQFYKMYRECRKEKKDGSQ